MAMLLFLVVLAAIITVVLVLVIVGRLGAVRDELVRLTHRIDWLASRLRPAAPEHEAEPLLPLQEAAASAATPPVAEAQPVVREPDVPLPVIAEPAEAGLDEEPAAKAAIREVPEEPPISWRSPPVAERKDGLPAPSPESRAAAAESLETAIGQKWLVRIGALVLVVGMGFFYAYAIDQGWVTERQRAISGGIVGLAVMALGIFFNRRGFAPLAQGFVGCGAGLLFLDAFAAHHFYHLIDARVALLAMASVTALTAAIALRWSAMPLVLIAQIGGYLAPVLLEDQKPDRALVVFSYLFVIDAGFLLTAALKRWRPVEIVAAVATPLLFVLAAARDSTYPPESITAWTVAFDLLFLGMAVGPSIVRGDKLSSTSSLIVLAAALGTALAAEGMIAPLHPRALAMTLACLGILHAACAEGLFSRVRGDVAGRELLRACGAALALDALRFPFEARELTVMLAAAGIGLALLARARDSIAFRAAAAASFVFAIGRVLVLHLHSADPTPVAAFQNLDFAVAMAVAAALAIVSLMEKEARWIGLTAASLLAVIILSGEISLLIAQSVPDASLSSALVLVSRGVTAAGVLVGFASAARRTGKSPLLAISLLNAVIALALFERIAWVLQRPPTALVLNPICIGSLFLPLAMLAAARILHGGPAGWRPAVPVLSIAGSILPLVTLSIEAHRFFENHPLRDVPVNAASAAVSVTWALYAAVLLTIGITRRWRAVRLGALVLLGLTLIKVVISDLADLDRLPRIISFIALGVVLMSGAWAYHRFAERIFGGKEQSRAT